MRQRKSDRVWTWEDFFPDTLTDKTEQTIEDQIAIVEMFNEAFGGTDKRTIKEPTTA